MGPVRNTRRSARARGILCVSSLTLLAGTTPSSEEPPDPLPLAWCLERARVANPDLAIARAAAEAAEATEAQVYPAGALPDPRFRYELSNVPTGDLDLDSTPLSGHQLGLSQQLPFPGLLGRQREAARAAAGPVVYSLARAREIPAE